MDPVTLKRFFPSSGSFFSPTAEELRSVMPDADVLLPQPLRVFLDSEEATPLFGFPILITAELTGLREALDAYLQLEEEVQLAVLGRRSVNRRKMEGAWKRYAVMLERATENSVRSSYGRRLPSVFWLYHSIGVSRLFKEIPRRILRRDRELGRQYADVVKYRVLERYLDRVLELTYDVVHRVAEEAQEEERDLFPALLTRMRDNVLVLTEDHLSSDLGELEGFVRGYLGIDPKAFRERLARTETWLARILQADPQVLHGARHLLGIRDEEPGKTLLLRPGYVTYLSRHPAYSETTLLDAQQVKIWESLLLKLKEFELLLAFRRLILPVRDRLGTMTSQAPSLRGATAARQVNLSTSTRPLDFFSPWVIDPLIRRCGLIYDITDFSRIVSVLGKAGSEDQDDSYRSIFRFQRWVNQMARMRRLQLEKYLGDGALYSGRHPTRLLGMAIELQRYYKRALEQGFPFNRGLRMALNYGEYRLLPIEEGQAGSIRRHEFFGHGIVELSRLVTGKSMRELDAVRNMLLGLGYSAAQVDQFFAPALHRDIDVIDKREETRPFFSYINRNGSLVNEGIVATEQFIEQLEAEKSFENAARVREQSRTYLVIDIGDGQDAFLIGLRKLGTPNLKGLEEIPIYEVIDAVHWREAPMESLDAARLRDLLDTDFRQAKKALPTGPTGI